MGYLGSKSQAGVFQRIISQIPPHSFYVEPFFGSGQIFWRKKIASSNVIIDADALRIAIFKDECRRSAPEMTLSDPSAPEMTLPAVSAICGDAISILPTLTLPADAVIYCDPPYLHSTRTSRHRYKFEMSDDEHVRLLTLLQGMNSRILISGYPSSLYSEMLRGWRCISYRVRTRGRTLTECLWMNFPEPSELHDLRFFGKDFRQRLALKRQAARWLARVDAMSSIKRAYILERIRQRYF
jgi:DNA adenine methylase